MALVARRQRTDVVSSSTYSEAAAATASGSRSPSSREGESAPPADYESVLIESPREWECSRLPVVFAAVIPGFATEKMCTLLRSRALTYATSGSLDTTLPRL